MTKLRMTLLAIIRYYSVLNILYYFYNPILMKGGIWDIIIVYYYSYTNICFSMDLEFILLFSKLNG